MTDVREFMQPGRASARRRERGIAAFADRQHGVIARHQLAALGIGRGAIDHRVRTGRLHRLHVGVYAVGHRQLSREGRWMAAVLAFGQTAALSHRSAAALWGLLRPGSCLPEVTTARRCRGRPGIRLHRSLLASVDVAVQDRIPVTTVARTLLDLAEVAPQRVLARALEQAEQLRILDLPAVERLLVRCHGRRGLRALKTALADYRPPPFTRSGLERRFIGLCERAGVPRPAANLWLGEHEVDMSWPGSRLLVELDTHQTHRTLAAFERDRLRDARLQRAGYRVLRITDRQLIDRPTEVIATVRARLDRG